MLKHELKNVQLKRTKKIKINLANPQNTWPKSWGRDNPIEKKIKKKYVDQFSINPMLKDKVEKKIIKKTIKITWVNTTSSLPKS
jgi:hypothetical protein